MNRTKRFLPSVKLLLSARLLLSVSPLQSMKLQLAKSLPNPCLISGLRLRFPPSPPFRKQPYLQPCQKLPKHHPSDSQSPGTPCAQTATTTASACTCSRDANLCAAYFLVRDS